MTKTKVCPIRLGNSTIPAPSFWDESGCAPGILEARKALYQHQVGCLKRMCEWYEHGCPAHPVTKEVRDKIWAMK